MRRYGALLLLAGDGDAERLLDFDFVDFDLDDIVLFVSMMCTSLTSALLLPHCRI